MEELKKHTIASVVIAGITIAILQLLVGPLLDLVFSAILIGLLVIVARLAAKKNPPG